MLQALAQQRCDREIWGLHGALDGGEHAFATEARALLGSLPNARSHVYYSRPGPKDVNMAVMLDSAGRLTVSVLTKLTPSSDAEAYLCGPKAFMDEISVGLAALGFDASLIHGEPFGPTARVRRRGSPLSLVRAFHPPAGQPGDGPTIAFVAERPHGPMEQQLRLRARTRRVLRKTRTLVMSNRRLPYLRNGARRGGCRIQFRPG